ncbi:acetoacetate--CoA ligase [Vibrio sp. T187]|uniref:acetoacetate--CoA ligase n=1 Tax=Vibrio TaxID=662 RepID=UPI0010C9C5E5|nr:MULTISPECIES: acetoacetate--CoA ligase [Vibrio]MBW3695687.1 acetoacetate--CoA ligase [Vibrio sp. T187]
MSLSQPIWSPDPTRIQQSNMQQFIERVSPAQHTFDSYQQLHDWSVSNSDAFWSEVWDFCNIVGDKGRRISDEGQSKWQDYVAARDTLWFPDAEVNYAENLLSHALQLKDQTAVIFSNELSEERSLTWSQLCQQVSAVQQWLQDQGVEKGDVVAGYLPHIPETLIAMLATTSLGAVWTSTSPDFGVESVVERFSQVKPKAFFCCNGYTFNGKSFDMKSKNVSIANSLPSLQALCEIDYSRAVPKASNMLSWSDLLTQYPDQTLSFTRVGFNEPLFILYSSGTTGKPKCIVHAVGGTLLNHQKEHQLHCDIKPNDCVFYYTTCGWMMWNWHVSALAGGATLAIYDGSPMYPTEGSLWQFAEAHQITLFGTSAKYLEALQKSGYSPMHQHNLSSLKTLCSTGSVLYPEQFDFVYQNIKTDLHLASISGGTDICGCFVLGNPISPVFRGECQGAALGLDVAVIAEDQTKVIDSRGELACSNSFPNQPIGFWNDNGEKYHHAYWDKFEAIWHHGDDVMLTSRGGMLFYGRSDTTLNPGGVRIGTGEIYQQVNTMPQITDSIAVGRKEQNDESIVLFVQTSSGHQLDEELAQSIRTLLRTQCSPRHVPKSIYAISQIPKTKSGKLVELAVKQIVHGQEVKNIGAIANPEVLDEIKALFG